MNTTEYNRLKQKVEEKYQESLKLAEKQRKDGLEAIERVWNMLHNTEDNLSTEKTQRSPTKTKKSSYGSLTAAVKKALDLLHANKFTKNDIKLVLPQVSLEIANSYKDASLTGCLLRFEKQGIIKVAKRGLGSLPTVYKKAI